MRIGGRRFLVVPPHLAYQDGLPGRVPADATLYFEVLLLGLVNPAFPRALRFNGRAVFQRQTLFSIGAAFLTALLLTAAKSVPPPQQGHARPPYAPYPGTSYHPTPALCYVRYRSG
eukprot:276826-Rhodomonas_salina.1